jgi:glutathione peroxidase
MRAMNKLMEKFEGRLNVLAFPCNQFGHQTNENNDEILAVMKHVRPGNGFEPKFDMFAKVSVNGEHSHPIFKWLRSELPIPSDEAGDSKGTGCDDKNVIVLPRGPFDNTTVLTWSPVSRTDVAWNFEKFLVAADGTAFKRYSRFYDTESIAADIEKLL